MTVAPQAEHGEIQRRLVEQRLVARAFGREVEAAAVEPMDSRAARCRAARARGTRTGCRDLPVLAPRTRRARAPWPTRSGARRNARGRAAPRRDPGAQRSPESSRRRAGRARSRFAISSAAMPATRSSSARTSGAGIGCTGRTVTRLRIFADRVVRLTPLAADRARRTLGACPLRAMPLLVARGVTKRFGAVDALVDVDFDVDAGEVVALVGDNGAGKSTLIKAIAGVQPADAGEYWIDGRKVSIRTPSDATRHGVATVYQDLALCDNLDVVANLYLGSELVEPGLAQRAALARRDRDGTAHARAARLALGHHARQPADAGPLAVRRTTTGRGDRALAGHAAARADPRRADGRARRRADRRRSSRSSSTCASRGWRSSSSATTSRTCSTWRTGSPSFASAATSPRSTGAPRPVRTWSQPSPARCRGRAVAA